jgi:hypothetical protein
MADLSWHDLLNDAARFPDTMQWTMEDGSQIALGTLRQTLKGSFVPQTEYETLKRHSEEERRALLADKRTIEQQLVDHLSATQQVHTPPRTAQDDVPDIYLTDPLFKPMWSEVTTTKASLAKMQELLERSEQRNQQMAQTMQQLPVVLKVQQIQAQHPGTDANRLLDIARENGIPPHRLDQAYTLMTHDETVAKLQARAEKAEADLAAQAAQPPQVPYAPFGPPQTVPNQPVKFENDQALEQAMLGDMEMYQTWNGQA